MGGLLGFACAVCAFLSMVGWYGLGIEGEREESAGKAVAGLAMGLLFGLLALGFAYFAGRIA